MKKHFHKELVMTKEDNENFKNFAKCWICDNDYIDHDVKVRDYCHITGKYGASAHRDCNINLRLNYKNHMNIFFAKGKRGGISYITNRSSKVNNKYLKSYDPKQKSNHINYLDANNLCLWNV